MSMPTLALLLALSGCESPPAAVTPQGGVIASAETPQARVEAALGATSSSRPHPDILRALDSIDGAIAVDAPERLQGVDGKTLLPLSDGALSEVMWGTDESLAAETLRARGAEVLLLNRGVIPSVDRGGAVISRLYHDDFRVFFELLFVDDEWLVYQPLEKPRTFPPELARVGAAQIRQMIKGEAVPPLPPVDLDDGKRWNLVASVRREGGQELAIGMCLRDTFQGCLMELANDLEREHRRYAEWYGLPTIREDIDDLILELHRVTERARILSWEEEDLNEIWEMGIDGAIIVEPETNRAAIFPGAISYTRSLREPDRFLRHAAKQFHMNSVRPWRDPAGRLEKMRTEHYMDYPGSGLIPLFRGVPPVPMELVDIPALEQSLVLAGEWYLDNMAPQDHFPPTMRYEDGQVTYKIWPSEGRYSSEYNLVRHTLATWNLVQAWTIEPRPEFLEGARRALDWTLKYRKDETLPGGAVMTFIEYPGDGDPSVPPAPLAELPGNRNRKLGSVVVGLMGLIDLARATEDHQWDQMMVQMGEFILHQQEESGKFDPYYVPEGHPYADEANDIVPGEAALALVMLHEYTGDDRWLAPIPKFFAYYEPWWDERVARQDPNAAWPAYHYDNQTRLDLVQFGPWSVMAANAYHRATGDAKAAAFGLRVARWMIDSYMWSPAYAPWPDYVGGYYKLPGELPAMQAFCYAEGTAAAYDMALRAAPDEAAFFEESTRASARFALQMQFDDAQIYGLPRGEVVRGGTRYAMNETKVRIDYVYHAFSAVYQYLQAAKVDPNLSEDVKYSPGRRAMERVLAEREAALSGGERGQGDRATRPAPQVDGRR